MMLKHIVQIVNDKLKDLKNQAEKDPNLTINLSRVFGDIMNDNVQLCVFGLSAVHRNLEIL